MAVAVLPEASVTVHITLVLPIGYTAGALFVTDATEQLSDVTGVPRLTPVTLQLTPAGTTIFVGAVITGLTLSVTVTVNVQLACLPQASVTVAVTVVVPTGKNEPDG